MKISWKKEVGKISSFSRAVVAQRTAIGSGIGLVILFLTSNHVIPTTWAGAATHWINVGLDGMGVLSIAVGIITAHMAATPADPQLHPKDRYGNDLVSSTDFGPHPGVDQSILDALQQATVLYPMQSYGQQNAAIEYANPVQPEDKDTPHTPDG